MNTILNRVNKKILLAIFIGLLLLLLIYQNSSKPKNESFIRTENMNIARDNHTLTLMNNGRVLIIGGNTEKSSRTAEIFDPKTNKFKLIRNKSYVSHSGHSSYLLKSGKVLIIDGTGIEIFDPKINKFVLLNKMIVPRIKFSSVLLPNEKVLIAGGFTNFPNSSEEEGTPLVELYDIKTNKIKVIGKIEIGNKKLIALPDNKVIIFHSLFRKSLNAYIYDDNKSKLTYIKDYIDIKPTYQSNNIDSISLLNDGRILLITNLNSVNIFNPRNKRIDFTGKLKIHQLKPQLVSLPNNKFLIVGNNCESNYINSKFEILDLNIGNSRTINALAQKTCGIKVSKLANNDLLLTGGHYILFHVFVDLKNSQIYKLRSN